MNNRKLEIVKNIFNNKFKNYLLDTIKPVSGVTANSNFIITASHGGEQKKYFIKLYNNESRAADSCEPLIYKLLASKSSVLTKKHADGTLGDSKYIIIDFISGQELLKTVEDNATTQQNLASLAEQLLTFINECSSVTATGYGFLNTSNQNEVNLVTGVLPKWTTFFDINLNGLKQTLRDNSEKLDNNDNTALQVIVTALESFIKENDTFFNNIVPTLIPVDLNLRNFMVKDNQKLFAIDLESFLIGDSLLAYGELFGHVYKSEFGQHFEKLWNNWDERQRQVVHFYALLSNINVFSYQLSHTKENIRLNECHAWGNPTSFKEMMEDHYAAISRHSLDESIAKRTNDTNLNPERNSNPQEIAGSSVSTMSPGR